MTLQIIPLSFVLSNLESVEMKDKNFAKAETLINYGNLNILRMKRAF